MSEHSYLCDLYGLDPSQSHELIDVILEEDERAIRAEQEKILLPAGTLVHLVWLTGDIPAKVLKVEFNKILQTPLHFDGFNHLKGVDKEDPGSWFLQLGLGYKVRSKKVDGHWLQCVFGGSNLVRSEMIEYLKKYTNLNFDESKISEEATQLIGNY